MKNNIKNLNQKIILEKEIIMQKEKELIYLKDKHQRYRNFFKRNPKYKC